MFVLVRVWRGYVRVRCLKILRHACWMFLRPSGAPEGREHSDVHRFVLKGIPAALTREKSCLKRKWRRQRATGWCGEGGTSTRSCAPPRLSYLSETAHPVILHDHCDRHSPFLEVRLHQQLVFFHAIYSIVL